MAHSPCRSLRCAVRQRFPFPEPPPAGLRSSRPMSLQELRGRETYRSHRIYRKYNPEKEVIRFPPFDPPNAGGYDKLVGILHNPSAGEVEPLLSQSASGVSGHTTVRDCLVVAFPSLILSPFRSYDLTAVIGCRSNRPKVTPRRYYAQTAIIDKRGTWTRRERRGIFNPNRTISTISPGMNTRLWMVFQ